MNGLILVMHRMENYPADAIPRPDLAGTDPYEIDQIHLH